MIDINGHISAIKREVSTALVDGKESVIVQVRRTYGAEPEDVWDALTDPDRLRRWFLPVTGDLRLGGTFQTEGNAGGTIRQCEPPRVLVVTWGSDTSVVRLDLSPASDGTVLHLRHSVPMEFAQSGAGSLFVGPGWDSAVMTLAEYLAGTGPADPAVFIASDEVQTFTKDSLQAWTKVVESSGTATDDELAQAMEVALPHWAPA